MSKMSSVLLLLATVVSVYSRIEEPWEAWEEYFDHYTFLRPQDDYRLYWKIMDDEILEIGLEVESTGWIGFGISDDTSMFGADIIMGWIDDDDTPYLQRRHVSLNQRNPVFDENLIDDLIASNQEDGITRLHFKRELFPCADEEDPFVKQIRIGTTFIIFAYNNANPICVDDDVVCSPLPHAMNSMGSQSINFFSGESSVVKMPDTYDSFDFLMNNYSVPATDTTYHCKFIEIPQEITNKSHLIRIDPIIEQGNEAAVHHIVLFWCQEFDIEYLGFEDDCNNFANMPDFAGKHCESDVMLSVWAVGGGIFYMPEHVGFPLSGKIYTLLEIHYDNPNELDTIVDNSGVRLYWTEELRENDAGIFRLRGAYKDIFIPGDMNEKVVNSFHSAPECTLNTDIDPDEGINAFVGFLHEHTIGVAVKLRHIRDNKELKTFLQNDNYDFNYQQWTQFSEETKIYPGDEFICECTYDTQVTQQFGKPRQYPTYGGQSTRDEMCSCWFYYYPASNNLGEAVGSIFTDDQFADFFGTAIDNGWFNGTTKWYNNSINRDIYYYNSQNEEAFEHYLQFQATIDRNVVCNGCPDGICDEYIIPTARDDFEALPEDDFGNCLADEQDKQDEKLLTDAQVIIISVAGGLFGLLVIVGCVVYCQKKRKGDKIIEYENMEDVETNKYGAVTTQ